MFYSNVHSTTSLIHHCAEQLQAKFRQTYGNVKPGYVDLLGQVAASVLRTIAHTDAPYHNLEHTVLVTIVGQEILYAKHLTCDRVSCEDWVNFIVALLHHDIGYLKGVCAGDSLERRCFATGIGKQYVVLPHKTTDASLTAYHVDRSKQVITETLGQCKLLDLEKVKQMVDFTRFPVPKDPIYQDTFGYPGLARAADLIGQLSDPLYLEKLPALFHEFVETGKNESLGYHHPDDIRQSYPKFFRHVVLPLIHPALQYLSKTLAGQQILRNLYGNIAVAEQECNLVHTPEAAHNSRLSIVEPLNESSPRGIQDTDAYAYAC
jgi:hypothetical protein